MKGVDNRKVYGIVGMVKRCGDFEYTASELERKGLKGICIEYSIDYDWLNKAEKELLWQELLEMAEEVEFIRYFNDDLHWK